jgi:E3 ubiquitin-protein ligase MARCH5
MVYVIELCDRILYAASPFAAATFLIGSIYWTAVSYGAVTVMQVLGQEEGKAAMESADPLMLLVGLPSIPVMLVLGKLIRWEDQVLKFWRSNCSKIPLLSYFIGEPPENPRDSAERILIGRDNFSDPISATRLFCGALVLPTVATIVGRYLYTRVSSNFQRAVLGGFTYIVAKGVVRIYLRQQQYIRQTKRKVLNYAEETCNCSETKPRDHDSTSDDLPVDINPNT